MPAVASSRLRIGMEVHVELATRTKMFTRAPSPATAAHADAPPNTLIDPVVLALPGALPVLNAHAIELAVRVGLALGCTIARDTRWDRKGYFYPDLPKAYQISQHDMPLCGPGVFELPPDQSGTGGGPIRITRAHLEEDAGKLLHEAPAGGSIDGSIVDFNRAGTPLLEIVTEPDFTDADQCVRFAQLLRNICRFVGATEGVMQRGHIRFEPNINMDLTLDDGRIVTTPIVEVKNLNSFRSLRGAIEHERRHQPQRFLDDGAAHAPGRKTTRGWDDAREITFLQRSKEEAHDYRYFPDPDLLPLVIDPAWAAEIAATLPELPHARAARYARDFALSAMEAAALVEERPTCEFYEACTEAAAAEGVAPQRAGRAAANLVLQTLFKLANERSGTPEALGISPELCGQVIALREADAIGSSSVEPLVLALCEAGARDNAHAAADRLGLLQVRDDSALEAWCKAAIDDPANAQSVADFRAGKQAALGRLIGAVMTQSAGRADAKAVRERLRDLLAS